MVGEVVDEEALALEAQVAALEAQAHALDNASDGESEPDTPPPTKWAPRATPLLPPSSASAAATEATAQSALEGTGTPAAGDGGGGSGSGGGGGDTDDSHLSDKLDANGKRLPKIDLTTPVSAADSRARVESMSFDFSFNNTQG